MTAGDRKIFDLLNKRVRDLEQKLTDPDWEHVNSPVAYAQGAYKRICALEREVESRIQAGQDVRRRLSRVEKRVDTAHERRGEERLNYRVGIIERQDQRRDIKRRALFERRLRSRAALCNIGVSVSYIFMIGFAIYGVVTLVSKLI